MMPMLTSPEIPATRAAITTIGIDTKKAIKIALEQEAFGWSPKLIIAASVLVRLPP
jgi:hypothetical protein